MQCHHRKREQFRYQLQKVMLIYDQVQFQFRTGNIKIHSWWALLPIIIILFIPLISYISESRNGQTKPLIYLQCFFNVRHAKTSPIHLLQNGFFRGKRLNDFVCFAII